MADNDRPEELTAEPTPSAGRKGHRGSRPNAAGRTPDGSDVPADVPYLNAAAAARADPERTCVVSGAKGARDALVRLVLGPDGIVAPDVRAKAGGRGAWIAVDRLALEAALAKGRLKGGLARAFKTSTFHIPADLGERIATALERSVLDRLGLEARAGALLTGSDRIMDSARKGAVHLLLHASDAGEDGSRKLDQAWRVGGGDARGLVVPVTRTILSMALGRENVVHIALIAPAAAARVSHALRRWRSFIGSDDAAEPCESRGSSALERSSEGSGLPDER
ncbi:MAG: hypothetical protein JWL91_2677 [Sphingomonas bacterium]|jgi:predicted RNA-binding protein YlxR (DUF448 family)|nr:DUF448 domain-containing protein [Sphingomonas bacterium]MDB5690801.1 hypothetical protein [Sphingomonas bacterium]